MHSFLHLFETLVACVDAGRPCALCTVVNSRGSTPQTAGATLLLHADGRTEGTLGGGCVEAEVRRRALLMLDRAESGLLTFRLNHDYGWDDGLICGGTMEVAVQSHAQPNSIESFREALARIREQRAADVPLRVQHEGKLLEYRLHIEPTPTLLIAGAGHVGAALGKLAVALEFRAVVIDDRADLLVPARLPPPIEGVCGAIDLTLRRWPIDANAYVVIVTRGHRHDEQALHAVIDSPARYLGMIGSRRKVKLVFDDLIAAGVDPARLQRVHAPIGSKINAVTVPEIALSIAAELTQVRRENHRAAVVGPFECATAAGLPVQRQTGPHEPARIVGSHERPAAAGSPDRPAAATPSS
jgi:xanthine dehydrogenase accessory factor